MTVFSDLEKPPDQQAAVSSPKFPCPRCGQVVHEDQGAISGAAQQRICELELQLTMLTTKASTAVDKLADYEDELRQGRSRSSLNADTTRPQTTRAVSQPSHPTDTETPDTSTTLVGDTLKRPAPQTQSRFSSFLLSRKTSATSDANRPSPPTRRESDLEAALAREQSLRQQAEGKLTQVNGEIEELSMQLFQQANDMVSTERRARARLEERVKLLERRDVEKRKRLERLEDALKRIERARSLLGEG